MKKNEFLKELRIKHKLSRAKIGKLLGVSSSYIEKLELGISNITPTTKYIQGICALYGYNPEIFNYNDITPELLEKYELSKFSKSIRKYLYFSGIEDNILNYILDNLLKIINIETFSFVIPDILTRIKRVKTITINGIKYTYKDILMLELLIIVALEKFKPSEFGNIDEYIDIINYKDEFMKKWNFIIIDDNSPLNYSKDTLKDKLLKMEKNGLEVDISTIKYAYTYIRYKNLENEVKQLETELNLNPAEVTNPKIKEICDLLEYAPDTFKDKIIQKLNEYKQLEDF